MNAQELLASLSPPPPTGVLTLGDLIKQLEADLLSHADSDDDRIWADSPLGWLTAKRLCSYRGFYDQPALVVNTDYETPDLTVSDFLDELKEMVSGKTYYGYKGGEYRYGTGHHLWVTLARDRTSDLLVSGVEKLETGGWLLSTKIYEW